MIASTHLAVGSASALFLYHHLTPSINDKLKISIAFGAGLASHILLDAFPHQEYVERWPWPLVIAETIIVLAIVLSFRYGITKNLVLFFGMAGAAMPDFLHIIHVKELYLLSSLHYYHGSLPLDFLVSMFYQYILAFLAIAYIKIKAA